MRPYSAKGLACAERVRRFGERFVVHKKDRWAGTPFVLEPWQWENIVAPIYGRLNRHGRRKYQQALIGLPRWSGKSEILALMVMYHLFVERVQEGECYVVASNERQANIVFLTVKRMVQANPLLAAACDIYKREIWVKETGCIFKALPADADSAQGFHPSFCAVDEVHVHKNHALIEAMVSGMVAREEPLLVAITTAGVQRAGVLWEMLNGSDEQKPWTRQPNTYVYWHGAADSDDPHDPRVWRAANPASWITAEMLQRQYDKLPLWSFERYHLNRFPQAQGLTQAFPIVHRCVPGIDPTRPVVLGLDAAPSRDRCALIIAQRDDEGFHHWQPFVWAPGKQMDFGDFEAIEQQVRELAEGGLYISRIVSDPAFVWLALNRLKAEGFPVEVMKQDNAHMCNVAANLHKLLSGDRIRFDDDDVYDDLTNVKVEERPPWGWRMGKLDNSRHIDCAIAGGMASFALEADEDGPSFAETGGIYTIPAS